MSWYGSILNLYIIVCDVRACIPDSATNLYGLEASSLSRSMAEAQASMSRAGDTVANLGSLTALG